jgi:CubicO group peptidase (beta-lactamase class C family)
MKFSLITLIFACALSGAPKAQTLTVNLDYEDQIGQWLNDSHVPSVGIGIIEKGTIKYSKTFGQIKPGVPAPSNTIFNVASLTKPVSAMVILRLVDAGLWNLDEPLSAYWIDPDIKDDPRHLKLTTRIVLSHQTGFPNWRWDRGDPNKLTFDFEPGSKYQYSGEGFEYLRIAVEKKFGLSLSQLARKYLFDPLSMNDTRYTWDRSFASRFASWHNKEGLNSYETLKRSDVSAADDLLITVEDYCKFGVDVLNGGGLSAALLKEMSTQQAHVKEHVDCGLGWLIVSGLPNNEYALVHTGSDRGVRTAVILLPNSRRGLIVFTNGDRGMEVIRNVVSRSLENGSQIINRLY